MMLNDKRIVGFKSLWLSAALAALTGLAIGCAENVDNEQERLSADGQQAVTFGAQTRRGTTRAGAAGEMTLTNLQSGDGFGVFAYYSDNGLYDGTRHPDFMYNQQVTWDAINTKWTYDPVKYWPNEYGPDAESAGQDRLSFFAYAPWVGTGVSTTGITGLSRQEQPGDPYVNYTASWDPAECVDLLWGTDDQGRPITNMTKPAVNEKVDITLRHALAKLNLQVDADVDDVSYSHANDVDGSTRIYVRSVTLTGVAPSGRLCLNNVAPMKPRWLAPDGSTLSDASPVTIHDGRRNGQEALYAQPSETPVGLNPVVVQSAPYGDTPTDGVTKTAVNLLNGATLTDAVYVIPTGDAVNVTITYDVETVSPNLATTLSDGVTHGRSIENTITKQAVLPLLDAGKSYTIVLHLGLTSVKFDAKVNPEWGDGDEEVEVDLAHFAALNTPLTLEATQNNTTVTFYLATNVFPASARATRATASTAVDYSLDGGKTWEDYTSGYEITLSAGEKVSFRGMSPRYATGKETAGEDYSNFVTTGDCYLYGNVMSLIDSVNYATETTLTGDYAFAGMFTNTNITNHPSKELVLPATTLTESCYRRMFVSTKLRTAPVLPAGTLAPYCYTSMFLNCASLETAPELPSIDLADYCYNGMFYGCTKLTTIPNKLPAEDLAPYCYQAMFYGCTSLEQAPELPAKELADYCYSYMFYDCKSLMTAPTTLPAEELAPHCYRTMFYNCESLETAPEISATKCANYCCRDMFYGCSSLKNVPSKLPAEQLAQYCYYYMFEKCTSLERAPELPATTLVSNCYNQMFKGCSKLNYVKAMFTATPSATYTSNWLNGVATSGTFIRNSEAEWNESSITKGASTVPSGWTIETAP